MAENPIISYFRNMADQLRQVAESIGPTIQRYTESTEQRTTREQERIAESRAYLDRELQQLEPLPAQEYQVQEELPITQGGQRTLEPQRPPIRPDEGVLYTARTIIETGETKKGNLEIEVSACSYPGKGSQWDSLSSEWVNANFFYGAGDQLGGQGESITHRPIGFTSVQKNGFEYSPRGSWRGGSDFRSFLESRNFFSP